MKTIVDKLKIFWQSNWFYPALAVIFALVYLVSQKVGIYDWQKEIAYFDYIRSMLKSEGLPFFWWNIPKNTAWYPAVNHSANFIANPETFLFSPLVVLLFFFNAFTTIKILTLFHLIIGIAGLFALKNKLNWRDNQFRVFSILFLFSPVIIQHLAIGYTPWLNLYFFPWILYFVAEKNSIKSWLGTTVIMALILLQGGTHVFIWFLIFILLYFIFDSIRTKSLQPMLKFVITLATTVALSFVRIYTTSKAFGDFNQEFQIGYSIKNFLFWSVTPPISFKINVIKKLFLNNGVEGVPSWDGGIFLGFSILAAITLIAYYFRFKKQNKQQSINCDAIYFSAIAFTLLSFYKIWYWIIGAILRLVHLPFASGAEKYPFRFWLMAFLILSFLIAEYSDDIASVFKKMSQRWFGIKFVNVNLMFELLIFIPFLYVFLVWFSLLNSVPANKYLASLDEYDRKNYIFDQSTDYSQGNSGDYYQLDFKNDYCSKGCTVTLKNFRARDLSFLQFANEEGTISDINIEPRKKSDIPGYKEIVGVVPSQLLNWQTEVAIIHLPPSSKLTVTFNKSPALKAIKITLISWALLLIIVIFFLAKRIFAKNKGRNKNKRSATNKHVVKDQEAFFDDCADKEINYKKDFYYEYARVEIKNGFNWLGNCSNIIDYGCGVGSTLDYFLSVNKNKRNRKDYNFLGVDISGQAINVIKNKYPEYSFRKISDNKIPNISKNSFDAVYLVHVLHHSKKHGAMFKEIYSKLKKGGKFFLCDLSSQNPILKVGRNLFVKSPRYIQNKFSEDLVKDGKIPDKYPVDPTKIADELKRAGFKVEKTEFGHLFLFVFGWIDRFIPLAQFGFWQKMLRKVSEYEKKLLGKKYFQNKSEVFTIYCEK